MCKYQISKEKVLVNGALQERQLFHVNHISDVIIDLYLNTQFYMALPHKRRQSAPCSDSIQRKDTSKAPVVVEVFSGLIKVLSCMMLLK